MQNCETCSHQKCATFSKYKTGEYCDKYESLCETCQYFIKGVQLYKDTWTRDICKIGDMGNKYCDQILLEEFITEKEFSLDGRLDVVR